ncbi:hypothetical protein Tco_0077304 [Tanacetum coccineum]
MTHPSPKRNMVPKAVLMTSGLVSVNIARQVNTAHTKTTVNGASPMSNISKTAHSTVKRPINKNTAFKNSNQRVNIVKDKNFNTARPKEVVNVVRPKAVVNAVKGNNINVVKASAWNMSYLTDYEDIDPYTRGNFMPPKLCEYFFFSGLEEFTSEPIVIKPVVENSKAKASKAKPKAVRKNNGAPIIEDWVSDNEKDDVPQAKIEKKTFKPSFDKIEFVKPKQQEKTARKTLNTF